MMILPSTYSSMMGIRSSAYSRHRRPAFHIWEDPRLNCADPSAGGPVLIIPLLFRLLGQALDSA
jgi:hypothetical protein